MKASVLPGARAALIGQGGLTEPPFYRWMQAVDVTVTANSDASGASAEDIATIAKKLGSPDGSVDGIPPQGDKATINGIGSILVDGSLETGLLNISLEADTQFPGATTYYGADSSGKRGWFPVSGALADSATIGVATDATTGISSFNLIGFGALTTDALAEGLSHFYFSSERVYSALVPGDGISLTFAGGVTTISLVGIPIYVVDQAGNQLTDQAGNPVVSSQTTSLPVDWSDITSKPTTRDGYGITDVPRIGDPVSAPEYTLAGLPSAVTYRGCMVMCTNLAEGYRPVWSDGTNWRRFTDNTVAS